MISKKDSNKARLQRHKRIRGKVSGSAERPRLCVFKSSKHIYAQIIDDVTGNTLVACSTVEKDFTAYGGESHGDHRARVARFMQGLTLQNAYRVAAFCHEGTMLRALELVNGLREVSHLHCKNGGVCVFEYQGGRWSLLEWDV